MNDNERILLIQKREEIRVITQDILDLIEKDDITKQDCLEIKKKFVQILSLISILKTYMKTNLIIEREGDQDGLGAILSRIFSLLVEIQKGNKNEKFMLMLQIETICCIINRAEYKYPWILSRIIAKVPPITISVEKD